MRQLYCRIFILILLVVMSAGISQTIVGATEIEISGKIGGTTSQTLDSSLEEAKTNQSFAQPKQSHIALKKFPNTGTNIEHFPIIGIFILLIYFILSWRKAHSNKKQQQLVK